ncbi:hypothetical protein GQ42DRAFT_126262, partial [Ramicandelaber brevisporus]
MTLDAAKLTAIEWRSPEWLAMYGPLRRENVLDYFSLSPFWDTGCKNANLRMQMRVQLQQQQQQQQQQQMHPGMPVHGAQFVIQKQQRTSAREPARPLAVFYVINDCIYMAPDLYSVVSNRIRSVANCVKTGFELASQAVEYSIADGYSW